MQIPALQAHGATLRDGHRVRVRALRATDAAAERRFIDGLSPATRRARFLGTVARVDDGLLSLLMSEDAKGPTAVVAVVPGSMGEDIVGVARLAAAPAADHAEIAVTVTDAWQHRGLGTVLIGALRELARARGIRRLWSMDSSGNASMRDFAHALGARAHVDPGDPTQVIYELDVN
ncbi:GNAT family N-acetyltransferase [Cognatilysobacter lacus]|uniref:GNAT family N-acetyltransferase n=1 Tax=Cognatilysobacter lacus TaxID=1643323 RepID=A0A5D8Z518_9GAMM|nr:GNAT family N-acetyltransferase [Lysobacter lacus]TZF90018.1 GNAT family N-acetyltransferase [Lysobacter lacus]